jgi:hypoxanthine phosphoribosyltransferase
MSEVSGEPGLAPRYQIELPGDSSKPKEMVDKVMGELHDNTLLATLRAYRDIRNSGERDTSVFSLVDIRLSRFGENTDHPVLEPTLGSIIVEGSLAESRIGRFYSPDRVYRREDGTTELRGANYFLSYDANRKAPSEKLDVIEKDFRDGLSVLEQVQRPQNEKEFLMYLGVLDYLKIHSLSLLHAVTYGERNGQIPENEDEMKDYLVVRKQAIDLARSSVRRFYQAVTGRAFDSNLDNMEETMEDVVINLRKNTKENERFKFYPYPDANNPAEIMLGAREAIMQNPDTQTIVGLATGGTESAISAQLFCEYKYGRSPDLAILPFSFHSYLARRGKMDADKYTQMAQQIYPSDFKDKNVLIVDDNSSSGETLQATDTVVRRLGAKETAAHVVQHDPERILDKGEKSDTPYQRVFNVTHPGYRSTMGIVSVNPETSQADSVAKIKERIKFFYDFYQVK